MNKYKQLTKLNLFLIILFTYQPTFSQENFIPGYVITNDADTLIGFIDYRQWEKNPQAVEFKTDLENNSISFKPTDIHSFYVDNEKYVSGIIKAQTSPVKIKDLENYPKVDIQEDTAFLLTLFEGDKSLYYYTDPNGKKNFYIKNKNGFELLIYKKYVETQNDKTVVKENRTYLGQLALYLKDCGTINSSLEKVSYSQKKLIKLFQHYYICSPSNISFQKEIEKSQSEFGVLVGVSSTSLAFSSAPPDFRHLYNTDYNTSTNTSAGFYFNIILPRNQGKWSFYNELLLTTYKFMGVYNDPNNYSKVTTEIGQVYLNLNNLARFKYPIGQLFLFINGGISNGLSINSINKKKIESDFYIPDDGIAVGETKSFELGIILGTGIKYNRLSLEIRHERGNGFSKYALLGSTTKSNYLLFGYRF